MMNFIIRQLILITIILLASPYLSLAENNELLKSDVQVKDNGYLRVLKQYIEDDEKNFGGGKPIKYKNIVAEIQFLKPCIANKVIAEAITLDPGNPDFWDGIIPKFRCDYRFKVFVTYTTKEGTITKGDYIVAYWEDSSKKRRKTEMLPGEITHISFVVGLDDSNNPDSWEVWLPK